jgi:hypothetical protein
VPSRIVIVGSRTLRAVFLAVIVVVAVAGVVVARHPVAAATYRVTGTGDSILGLAYGVPAPGGTVTTTGRWLNLEYGRNAFTAGMSGSASTASAAKRAIRAAIGV